MNKVVAQSNAWQLVRIIPILGDLPGFS